MHLLTLQQKSSLLKRKLFCCNVNKNDKICVDLSFGLYRIRNMVDGALLVRIIYVC